MQRPCGANYCGERTKDNMAGTYLFKDKDFGTVTVSTRKGMKSVTALWKKDILYLNIPEGVPHESILQALDSMRDRIASRKPIKQSYYNGQLIHCFRHTVRIGTHGGKKDVIGYGGTGDELYINLHESKDLKDERINHNISACLCNLMSDRAPGILIPYAKDIAEKLGASPAGFEIGRGKRKLGHCTSKGIIQLSYYIMFLPEELVNYIICHELAHLKEMNHGVAFHFICNTYCNGKEANYKKALQNFQWPILK